MHCLRFLPSCSAWFDRWWPLGTHTTHSASVVRGDGPNMRKTTWTRRRRRRKKRIHPLLDSILVPFLYFCSFSLSFLMHLPSSLASCSRSLSWSFSWSGWTCCWRSCPIGPSCTFKTFLLRFSRRSQIKVKTLFCMIMMIDLRADVLFFVPFLPFSLVVQFLLFHFSFLFLCLLLSCFASVVVIVISVWLCRCSLGSQAIINSSTSSPSSCSSCDSSMRTENYSNWGSSGTTKAQPITRQQELTNSCRTFLWYLLSFILLSLSALWLFPISHLLFSFRSFMILLSIFLSSSSYWLVVLISVLVLVWQRQSHHSSAMCIAEQRTYLSHTCSHPGARGRSGLREPHGADSKPHPPHITRALWAAWTHQTVALLAKRKRSVDRSFQFMVSRYKLQTVRQFTAIALVPSESWYADP